MQGTPRFVARSRAVGRVLVADINFHRMPTLPSHLADRYAEVYASDRSSLRTFSDNRAARHGVYRGSGREARQKPQAAGNSVRAPSLPRRRVSFLVHSSVHTPRWPIGQRARRSCRARGSQRLRTHLRMEINRQPRELAHAEDFLPALAVQIAPE